MFLTYKLNIPINEGMFSQAININLFTEFNEKVASGYRRIVIGERGPYVELESLTAQLFIPKSEEYRLKSDVVYYVHYRVASKALVKVYYQKKSVGYADYQIGMYYISPLDLFTEDRKPAMSFYPKLTGQGTLF